MLNVIFSLLIFCLSFLAQPYQTAAETLGHQSTPQISAAKSSVKMEVARPSFQITPETIVVRDAGTPGRFPSKPWHPIHGFLGALLALAFDFEPKSVEQLGSNYLLPPFHPSPFEFYEIFLI